MSCPTCGSAGYTGNAADKAVKQATAPGNKLKALAKRPDTIKGGMSRGGKYSKN